jgi:hypothetical protein
MTGLSGKPRHLKTLRLLVLFQGLYYTVTGIWPLLHMASFMFITGPKTDLWLVRMVGLLALCSGVCFLYCRFRDHYPNMFFILAISNTIAFAAIDITYSIAGIISTIYLADAVLQLALISALLFLRPLLSEK